MLGTAHLKPPFLKREAQVALAAPGLGLLRPHRWKSSGGLGGPERKTVAEPETGPGGGARTTSRVESIGVGPNPGPQVVVLFPESQRRQPMNAPKSTEQLNALLPRCREGEEDAFVEAYRLIVETDRAAHPKR